MDEDTAQPSRYTQKKPFMLSNAKLVSEYYRELNNLGIPKNLADILCIEYHKSLLVQYT